jgi:ABC-2 type transport system permease protein
MRILAIAKRVLTELFRDKRTLALMLIAPLLVITLMYFVFKTNSTTTIKLATVNVSNNVNNNLKNMDNVEVIIYDNQNEALQALSKRKVDATIDFKDNVYDVTHANTDSSKTAMTKAVLNQALISNTINDLKSVIK